MAELETLAVGSAGNDAGFNDGPVVPDWYGVSATENPDAERD